MTDGSFTVTRHQHYELVKLCASDGALVDINEVESTLTQVVALCERVGGRIELLALNPERAMQFCAAVRKATRKHKQRVRMARKKRRGWS